MAIFIPSRSFRFMLVAASVLLAAACSQPLATVTPPKPVRVQAVVLSPATTQGSFTGAVHARVESELAFRVGGKVIGRRVDVGQRVRAGEVLAELDVADYALAAAAAINQQEAAAIDAEQAASDAARFARLLKDGAVSEGDVERQKARAEAARERLDQARRQAELARNRASYAVLRAPFDGLITALRFEAGQVVGEGQPVATLAADGAREIVIDLPESRVQQARGSTATATLWAEDGVRFAVTLRELSPVASAATRTYRARYRIGAGAPPTELGMTATVWLAATLPDQAPRLATLPASALHHRDGQSAVWVIDASGGVPTLVPVQVARYGQDDVQVNGLAEGQLVAIAGVQKLAPTMQVVAVDGNDKPVTAQAAPALAAVRSPALAR
jgi:RND family efflux transporter MFP subunit